MAKSKPLIPTNKLVDRLRLMASAGGMLTRDRIEAITQAADRLENFLNERTVVLEERIVTMGESEGGDSV